MIKVERGVEIGPGINIGQYPYVEAVYFIAEVNQENFVDETNTYYFIEEEN